MAGQVSGMIAEIKDVKDIIDDIIRDAESVIKNNF